MKWFRRGWRWAWESLMTSDGRRAWAFLALLGGSGIMTAMIAVILYWLRGYAGFLFWLALASHVQLALCLTGFMAMFVKREVEATRDGLKVKDINVDEVEGNVNVQVRDDKGAGSSDDRSASGPSS